MGRMEGDYKRIQGLFPGWYICSGIIVVMGAQLCECTKTKEFYIRWVNCMVHDLYLNEAVTKNMTWDYKTIWPSSTSPTPFPNRIKTESTRVSTAFSPEVWLLPSLLEQRGRLSSSHLKILEDGKSLSFGNGLNFWDDPNLFGDKHEESG